MIRVLITEDDPQTRKIITDVLRANPLLEIETAPNGRVALDMIVTSHLLGKPYRIVFLDWHMPQMEGIEVLKALRPQAQYKDTLFIMSTSVSEEHLVKDAIKSGANGYIIKPVTVKALTQKVDHALRVLEEKGIISLKP